MWINTVTIPCQHQAPRCPLRNPRMRSRPRLVSLPGTIIAFCRSLKLKTTINALVRHPRRAHKAITDQPSILQNAQQISDVDTDRHDGEPVMEEIEPVQQLTAVANATNNAPCDPGSLTEEEESLFSGNSVTSGVSSSDLVRLMISLISRPHTQRYLGNKIVDSALETGAPSLTDTYDEPTAASEQGTQRSRSPSPELLFAPLSPPPSHRKARKANAIIGPDDPRYMDVPLCRFA